MGVDCGYTYGKESEKRRMINQFIKDRHEAFVNAVLNDDWKAVRRYCKKYDVPMPKKEEIFKAGVYKAVQYATDIPEEIKQIAFEKCLMLGFSPLIKPYEGENDTLN